MVFYVDRDFYKLSPAEQEWFLATESVDPKSFVSAAPIQYSNSDLKYPEIQRYVKLRGGPPGQIETIWKESLVSIHSPDDFEPIDFTDGIKRVFQYPNGAVAIRFEKFHAAASRPRWKCANYDEMGMQMFKLFERPPEEVWTQWCPAVNEEYTTTYKGEEFTTLCEAATYPLDCLVVHLNDEHKWSRQEIVEWLRQIWNPVFPVPEDTTEKCRKEGVIRNDYC
jgi:hypothetical protein